MADCLYKGWRWINPRLEAIRPYECESWTCPKHRSHIARLWVKHVAAWQPTRVFTFTNVPKDQRHARLAWSHLVQEIRRRNGGTTFGYARFLESGHDTGMLHWHVVARGTFLPKIWLSRHALAVGLGKVTYGQEIKGATLAQAVTYVAKYVTKEAAPKGWRKVCCSRDVGPLHPPTIFASDWLLDRGEPGGGFSSRRLDIERAY